MQIPKIWTEPFSDYIQKSLMNEAAKLFRMHQLPETLDLWQKYRVELRENIWKNLGVSYDRLLDLDLRETGEIQMDGYRIKNVYYQSRPDLYVTGNLYIPDGKGPFPGVVGMHGHWTQGRLAERIQSRGHTLAKNGYVSLLVDAWGAGERSTKHGAYESHGAGLGGALFNIGESLMGAQVVDNMRAVDVLCSLDYVDSNKIGATGASGGGNQTMWLAALDERIVAAVPVVSVGTFESYIMRLNCICECLPNGLTFTEESGVLALVAPRALKICNCLKDSNPTFYPSEMLRSYTEARKVFQSYKRDSQLAYQIFNLPHGYWPDIRKSMLGWFDLHLKETGNGTPKAEKDFSCLPEEKLMVFKKGKRPVEVISIAEYCKKKALELKNTISKPTKNELKEVLKFSELKLKKVHQYTNNSEWTCFALETSCGRMIPVSVRKPLDETNDFIIMRKNDFNNSESKKGIVLFDAYGSGETASADLSLNQYSSLSRSLLWLGRTLYGEWCKEYFLLIEWSRQALGAENIELFGCKENGIIPILTAALLNEKITVRTKDTPSSFAFIDRDSAKKLSLGFCLPNILKWGDLDQKRNSEDA